MLGTISCLVTRSHVGDSSPARSQGSQLHENTGGQPGLFSEFKVSLGYTGRSYLQKEGKGKKKSIMSLFFFFF